MYRDGNVYDEIDKVIIEIYKDYGFKSFPLDPFEVCEKLGVRLVAYSESPRKIRRFLVKKSKYGFFVKESKEQPPTIYYNDGLESKGAIRLTIFHELKHYIFNDDNDDDDDLADYFARHFMGPTAFLIQKRLNSPRKIELFCGMSMEAAKNAYSNIVSRRKKYGMDLFDFEVPLIECIEPSLMEIFSGDIIETVKEENAYDL